MFLVVVVVKKPPFFGGFSFLHLIIDGFQKGETHMLRNRHLMMHHLMKNNATAANPSSPISSPADPMVNETEPDPVLGHAVQSEVLSDEIVEEIKSPDVDEPQENETSTPGSLPQQMEDVMSYKAEEPKKRTIGVKNKIV